MVNAWITHIKEFSQRNNLSYGCALSTPACSEEYRKNNPKPLTKKQQKAKAEEERLRAEEEARKKVKGRKPKYATEEEKYNAKLESNKMKRRERAEIKKKEKYNL